MAPTNQKTHHKLFSKKRFVTTFRPFYTNKRVVFVIILLFAAFGVVATLITNAAQLVNEETIVLSTGQQIRLGQNINTLKATLGNQLYRLNDRQYIYRRQANNPIEVVIDLDSANNVAIMHLTNIPTNYAASTGLRVGVDIAQVRAQIQSSRSLPRFFSYLRKSGALIDQTRSTQYLFSDPCQSTQTTALLSLVLKGQEAMLVRDLAGPDCKDKD
jgi:hypothetical protein